MPLSTKVIHVSVKWVDGQWELLNGGSAKMGEGRGQTGYGLIQVNTHKKK